jgi:IS30 family transposase
MNMNGNSKTPLTPALRKLIETCITLKTTNAKTLAAYLDRSPATIRTEFQRILAIMNVHCRYSALKAAEDEGWLYTKETNGED